MIEKKVEQESCPLTGYCVDGTRLSPIEVCKGIEGDYRKCAAHQHYAEEDDKHHNPPIANQSYKRN